MNLLSTSTVLLAVCLLIGGCGGGDPKAEPIVSDDSTKIDSPVEEENPNEEEPTEGGVQLTSLPIYDLSLEQYTYEPILTVSAEKGVPGEGLLGLGNTLAAFGGYYYVLLIEHGTARPKILKINQSDTSKIESGYLDVEDYRPRADGHHHFTMEVDANGQLHVIGDMHNYDNTAGNISRTQDHLPERLQGQHILYWRTSVAGDVSSFQFMGQTDEFAPKGNGFTYVKLFKDRLGNLYFSARNNIGKPDPNQKLNNRGAGLTRYNVVSEVWETIGDYPRDEENPAASAPVLAYETEPEADSNFYTKIISSVAFDQANRLHFSVTLNNNDVDVFRDIAAANGLDGMYHWNTDLVYLRSDNGNDFVKASGDAIVLPAGIDPGADQADIVFTRNDPNGDSILGIESDITTNRHGEPVIAFNKKALYPDAFLGNGATFAEWNGTNWDIYDSLGADASLDRDFAAIMTDPQGVITFIPKGTGRFWRMWRLDGELQQVSQPAGMSHKIGVPSKSFFQETGDILSRVYDKNTETLTVFRIRITRPDG